MITQIKLVDGRAVGEVLRIARVPIFLRIVHDAVTGKFDALDQLTDQAKTTEDIYAYEIRYRGFVDGEKYSGPFADYMAVKNPPLRSDMRDNLKWAAWCQSQAHRVNRKS